MAEYIKQTARVSFYPARFDMFSLHDQKDLMLRGTCGGWEFGMVMSRQHIEDKNWLRITSCIFTAVGGL